MNSLAKRFPTMNIRRTIAFATVATCLGGAISVFTAAAADPAPAVISAPDLASRLYALEEGTSYVRAKIDIKTSGPGKTTIQVQIKERRSKAGADVVYQVLWPKERKGESVLLKKPANRPPTGSLFVPPNSLKSLDASQMREPLLGSDLSYEDVIANFFAWDRQAIVGTEVVDGVSCQILESKPGKGEQSSYSRVRSWIDVARTVPLRVEKYQPSGQLARRITTTRVVKEDNRWLPATLVVKRPDQDSTTEIEGSKSRRGVSYSDGDFTPDGLKEVAVPRSAPE